jgi:hypothetical protein
MATGFRGASLRAIAFFGARCFCAAFFFGATFLFAFPLTEILVLAVFRGAVFCATARFAFARVGLELETRRFAPGFEDPRVVARDVERLRTFETALICEAKS